MKNNRPRFRGGYDDHRNLVLLTRFDGPVNRSETPCYLVAELTPKEARKLREDLSHALIKLGESPA